MQSKRHWFSLLFYSLFGREWLWGWECEPSRGVRRPSGLHALLAIWVLLGGLLLSIAGCGGAATTSGIQELKSYEGLTLRIACPGDPAAPVVRQFAPGWARRNGARVEVVTYDPKDPPSSVSNADAWILPPWRLGRWAASGDLLPDPETHTGRASFAWTYLLPLYRDQLLLWGQTNYALPLLGESPLCVYRADLFEEAKLRPPATWQEFEMAAMHFRDHPPASFHGVALPPLPEDPDALEREFFAIAAPMARRAAREHEKEHTSVLELFSFQYDLETGKPRIAEPGFVEALALLQRLQPYRKPGASKASQEAFRDGQAVLCLADASWVARFQHKDSAVRNKFGICQVPGSNVYFDFRAGKPQKAEGINRVPYLGAGGALAAVPKSAPHPDAAFALLAELCGPDISGQIVTNPAWGGGATRTDHLANVETWNSYDLNAAQRNGLVEDLKQTLTYPGLKNPAFRLRTPDEHEHQQVLIEVIRAALLEGKNPGAALQEAAQRWEALDRRKPLEERLTQYRHSLGLQ
jgi:multiple sugar transport system substrate-binding protein